MTTTTTTEQRRVLLLSLSRVVHLLGSLGVLPVAVCRRSGATPKHSRLISRRQSREALRAQRTASSPLSLAIDRNPLSSDVDQKKKKKSRLERISKRTAVTSPKSPPPPPPIVPDEDAAGGGGDATAEEARTVSIRRRGAVVDVLRGGLAAENDEGSDAADSGNADAVAFQATGAGRLTGEPDDDDDALAIAPCDGARRIAGRFAKRAEGE